MKYILPLLLLIAISSNAQSGMSVYGGISTAFSPDKLITPSGTAHNGYVVGANIRMLDDGLCFLFTGEYGTFNLMSNKDMSFFKGHSLSYLKGKFGIGFDLVHLGKKSKLRSKFQGNILYINDFDKAQVGATPFLRETGYSLLNEAIGGLSSGLGFTIGILDIDLEYEHGFYNIYYSKHESKLNFINLTTGVRF